MYGDVVREHSNNPRNQGPLEGATHLGTAGRPGEGPFMRFSFVVADGTIIRCGFESSHCPAAVATGSVTTLLLSGTRMSAAARLEPKDIDLVLGGLPDTKQHFPRLAVEAFRAAFQETFKL